MPKKTLHELYQRLVQEVYEDDLNAQMYYLSMIEDQRRIPMEYLLEREMLFIPNNEYIHHYLGRDADSYGCGLYGDTQCLWTLFAVIPVMDLTEEIVGLTGWDAQHKYTELSEGEQGLSMYKVSSKMVFTKEKYFLTDVSLLKHTFNNRVVFITDGVFDSISLNYHGIPAIALLGSTVSREVLYFLRWFNAVYVCSDNDRAGITLYNTLKKSLSNVYRVLQNRTKDIEELLRRDESKVGPISSQLLATLDTPSHSDIILRC